MAGHTPWSEIKHKASEAQKEAARDNMLEQLGRMNVEYQLIQESHRLLDESNRLLDEAAEVPPWRLIKWHRLMRRSRQKSDACARVLDSIDRMQAERGRTI